MGFIKKIFKIRPKSFLGIDIGTSSLRMVELKRKGKKLWIVNYGEASFDFSKANLKEKNISFEESAKELIKKIFKETAFSTKKVNIAIPDFFSFHVSFDLPKMEKEEISQALQYEIRPHIPLSLSEITLDYTVTDGKISKTPTRVLAVAIPNNIIEKYRKIASLSGLELRFLETEVSSLARALIGDNEREKVIGIIDFGEKSTTCNIVDSGVLKISHGFKTGGKIFTEALVNSLNISYDVAEEEKIKKGIKENDKVKEILKPLLSGSIVEVKKVFKDYYRERGKKVEKVIVFGKSALMPGLKEYFEECLSIEVEIANPFKNISYSPELNNLRQERKISLGIAIGIAMKELKGYN